jgi:hypothetical protein
MLKNVLSKVHRPAPKSTLKTRSKTSNKTSLMRLAR